MSVTRASLAMLLATVLAGGRADAVEGVVEINQASALAGLNLADLPGFPVTLVSPGSYVLTGNLTVGDANTNAIEINSNGVTLDLNGFVLSGPTQCNGTGTTLTCAPSGSGVGVLALAREGIVIRNGSVIGFPSGGLYLFLVEACQIANVTTVANGSNGIRMGGTCEVTGVMANGNGAAGIFVFTNDPTPDDSPSDDIVARESVLAFNRLEGVFTTSSAGRDRFVLLRSAVRGNGDNGLDLRTEGDVRDCAIYENHAGGIDLGVNSQLPDSGLVRRNAVRLNAYGFNFDPAHVGYTHNNFTGNTAASTGGVAIGPNVCESDTICP